MDNKNNRVVLKNENQIEVKTSEREMIFYHWLTCVLAFRTWKCYDTSRGKFQWGRVRVWKMWCRQKLEWLLRVSVRNLEQDWERLNWKRHRGGTPCPFGRETQGGVQTGKGKLQREKPVEPLLSDEWGCVAV